MPIASDEVEARPSEGAAALTAGDEILLPNLSRRAAIVESAVLVMFVWVAPRLAGYLEDILSLRMNPYTTTPAAVALPYVALFTGLTIGLSLALLRIGSQSPRAIGLRFDNADSQVFWGGLTTVTMAVIGYGATLLLIWIERQTGLEWLDSDAGRHVRTDAALEDPRLSLVLVYIALGVWGEETLFRGLLLTRLRRALGTWWAAVFGVSLAFGYWHLDRSLYLGFVTFLGSILLCLVFIRQRSLLAAMTAHFLYNLLVVTVHRTGWV